LRAGLAVDNNGETTWSAGFGYRLTPTVEAQFAYQSNTAPELNPELGRARLIMGSLALRI
jgi:hypothetical protein